MLIRFKYIFRQRKKVSSIPSLNIKNKSIRTKQLFYPKQALVDGDTGEESKNVGLMG